MSLSEIQNFSDIRRSDSFDDRICDDLSEVILQYLPIEDKLHFECVSKQFQRTIFQRHNELIVDFLLKFGYNSNILEVLLKKLPQITCLRHSYIPFSRSVFSFEDSEIELILKNCNNLVKIDLDLSLISETTFQQLVQKFGSKLVSFTPNSKTIEMIGNWFPNINEMKILFIFFEWSQDFALPVKNLKKISIEWDFTDENQTSLLIGFKEFVGNNKSLTHLSLDLFGIDLFSEQDLLILSKQISQLNQLISFKLESSLPIQIMIKFLEQISQKCLQIKCLDLNIDELSKETDVQQLMSVLKKFKRLYIKFSDVFIIENIDSVLNNSFKNGFKGLTHLSLDFGISEDISIEILLKDFGIHSPDLRYLNIDCSQGIKVSNEFAVTFSQFSRLEYLSLSHIADKSVIDFLKTQVINNCKNIKSIEIY